MRLTGERREAGLSFVLGGCVALYLLGLCEVFTQVFGESLFYHSLLAGIFLCAAAWGRAREARGGDGARFAPWLAVTGGLSASAVFYAVSLSLKLRTRWLGELKAKLPEDAGLAQALKAGGGIFWKAVATSPLPALCLAFGLCAACGYLAGATFRKKAPDGARAVFTGAFAASVLFALCLLPETTVFQIGLGAGLVNALVAVELARGEGESMRRWAPALAALALLAAGFLLAGEISRAIDRNVFTEGPGTHVVRRLVTKHKTVTLVSPAGGGPGERVLYLNHWLQWTFRETDAATPVAIDNQRSVLVHPPLAMTRDPRHVLVLGGGDGLIAREALKYPAVRTITNVEADRQYLEFSRSDPEMTRINGGSFKDSRVALEVADPFDAVRALPEASVDVVLKDFPEGVGERLARSVSVEFFRDVRRVLRPGGIFSVHSDYYGTGSFWTIARALKEAGFTAIVALNDNFSAPDALEGILWASTGEMELDRIPLDPRGRFLIDRGVLPPVEGLAHDSDPRFIDYRVATAGRAVNSLYRPVYLKRLREENGFFLPLVYQIGVY